MSSIDLPNIVDHSRFKLVPITALKGTISISDPKFTLEEVKAHITSWVEKQDRFWPEELTSDILTEYIQCAFAPHWVLDGQASGSWSANIGQDRTVNKTCSHCQGRGEWQGSDLEGKPRMFNCASCNGTGQTSHTVTDWHSQSGVATGHINGKVLENVANDTPIRCGKREFSAEESWLTEPFPDDILIFEPEAVGNEAGLELAETTLRDALHKDGYNSASSLGQVRNFKIGHVNIESKEARTWLYPIYVASYKFGDKEYLIEMDGITGKLDVEIPGAVQAKRILKWLAILAVIAVIGFGIYMVVISPPVFGLQDLPDQVLALFQATATPTVTTSPEITPTDMPQSSTATSSIDNTPTITDVPDATVTSTQEPSKTPSRTPTPTYTLRPTNVPTHTPTRTPTKTPQPTSTPLPPAATQVSTVQNPTLASGQATIFDSFTNYGQSGFRFSTNSVVAWDSNAADILAAKPPSFSSMSFFLQYDAPPFNNPDLDKDARSGIIAMQQTEMNQVSECPASGYTYHWAAANLGSVYCVRTRSGEYYAVIKLTSTDNNSLSFTWEYQPDGSRRFH